MTTNVTHFKQRLEAEKEELLTQLRGLGRINPDNVNDWEPVAAPGETNEPAIEERASEITSFEERSAVEFEIENKLNEVNTALESIANNTFGVCATCNSPIEADRLEAYPSARTCKAHME